MPEPRILQGAEEFSLGEGRVGALLVHGFTGSPQGLRGLGEHLAERGVAVEGIRLPGHGTTWQDLNVRRPDEWVAAVEQGFEKVASGRDKVFLVALSFGAALAVDFCARHTDDVAGLVTLAGFVSSKDPRRWLAPVIRRVVKTLPGVANDISDPEGKEIAYDLLPTTAAYHMLRFLRGARAALSQVTCPILVMHSHNDHTVDPSNAQVIFDSVRSTDKELVWVDNGYHVITLDHDRDEVFERTHAFIEARS